MKEKRLYSYCGGVLHFDELAASRWSAQTYAVSEKKATSNFCQQFRRQMGYENGVPIKLSDKVVDGYIRKPAGNRAANAI